MGDHHDPGLQLRLERVRQRRLQREVAHAASLRPSRLSEIEMGWCEPNSDELSRLARALGLEARDLRCEDRP